MIQTWWLVRVRPELQPYCHVNQRRCQPKGTPDDSFPTRVDEKPEGTCYAFRNCEVATKEENTWSALVLVWRFRLYRSRWLLRIFYGLQCPNDNHKRGRKNPLVSERSRLLWPLPLLCRSLVLSFTFPLKFDSAFEIFSESMLSFFWVQCSSKCFDLILHWQTHVESFYSWSSPELSESRC